MRFILCLLLGALFAAQVGCTSHSWTKIERTYEVGYHDVFQRMPEECKKWMMSVKKSQPEAGLIVLESHRVHDQILTGSVINMIAGDEVILKVQQVTPTTTKIFIDSKAKGQIGPDFGRTDRNVTTVADALDKVWAQVDATTEERGEKRPGSSASQPNAQAKTQ